MRHKHASRTYHCNSSDGFQKCPAQRRTLYAEFVPAYHFHSSWQTLHARTYGRRSCHALEAQASFVSQALNAPHQKPPRPFVDIAATDLTVAAMVRIGTPSKPCHHFLYSGGAFVRLYPVNPGSTRNRTAKTKRRPHVRDEFALDIWRLVSVTYSRLKSPRM